MCNRKNILAAALLLAAGHAAAQYSARLAELEPAIEAIGNEPLARHVRASVQRFLSLRGESLAESRSDFLQQQDARPVDPGWVTFHQGEADNRVRDYTGAIDAAEDIIEDQRIEREGEHPAITLLSRTSREQHALHQAVKRMPLAKLRDELEAKRATYNESYSELEGEQSALESADNSIDSSLRAYRDNMLRACIDLGGAKRNADRDLSRLANEPNAGWDVAQARGFASQLASRVNEIVRDIQLFASQTNTGVGRVDSTLRSERSTLEALIAKRKDVHAVMQNFNPDVAEARYRAQYDAVRKAANSLKPDGDRKDLIAFVADTETDLGQARQRFNDAYVKYETRFKGIFIAPFDNSSNERFVEFAEWEKWARAVQDCDPLQLLEDLEDSASNQWRSNASAVANAEARGIVNDALREQSGLVVAATATALSHARRLDALTRLDERKSLQDQLNRGP